MKKQKNKNLSKLKKAVRAGVPLAGLFAALPMAGGCEDKVATLGLRVVDHRASANQKNEEIEIIPMGDITTTNQKNEKQPETPPPLMGVYMPPPEKK